MKGFSGVSKTLHGFFWRIENPARVSRLRKRTLFEIRNEFPGRSKPPNGFFWRIDNPSWVFLADRKPFMGFSGGSKTPPGFPDCANVHYLKSKMSFLADRNPRMGFSGGSKTLHGFFWRIENPSWVFLADRKPFMGFSGGSKTPPGFPDCANVHYLRS